MPEIDERGLGAAQSRPGVLRQRAHRLCGGKEHGTRKAIGAPEPWPNRHTHPTPALYHALPMLSTKRLLETTLAPPSLPGAGSRVDYVLQVDVSDTVVARNPFQLFAEQAGQYDLWVNVQRNTQWVRDNYQVRGSGGGRVHE